MNGEQVFRGSKTNFRYKKYTKQVVINPPSKAIHVSNLDLKAFDERFLYNYFRKHGFIDKIR